MFLPRGKKTGTLVLSAVVALIFIMCNSSPVKEDDATAIMPGKINLFDYELMYKYQYSKISETDSVDEGYTAFVHCMAVGDSVIGDVAVTKYRFIKLRYDIADTAMYYMHITDSSLVNYASQGNMPFLLLKAQSDTVHVEGTPYTTMLFPYRKDATWETRHESNLRWSTKQYIREETINVDGGRFHCAVVHSVLMPDLDRDDLWSEQWWCGTVLVKSRISMGATGITDDPGREIGVARISETYELEDYRKLR